MKLNLYFTELKYLLLYIIAIFFALIFFYSVFATLDADKILMLSKEDGLYEWLTVVFFLGASVFSLRLYLKTRNFWFILFCAAFFFAAGEEISWGQRLLGFETPESIGQRNMQNEFTVHNLYVFSRMDAEMNEKTGIMRLLEFNFLFKVGTIIFGMIIPFLVFHFKFFQNMTNRIKFPVPPITIGSFFLLNWGVYKFINTAMPVHAIRSGEIYESLAAFTFFVVFLFYYWERKNVDYIGNDIKHTLPQKEKITMIPIFSRKQSAR